jgi:hypothetical protein
MRYLFELTVPPYVAVPVLILFAIGGYVVGGFHA